MKEYNSIHELYNLYHRIHGTDQSLDRVESVEEARLFFKRYGEDLERASEEAQRESPPFSTWMTDSRFWIAFLVFLGALIAKFRFGIRFSSIVVLSGSAALYPIVCNHNGQSIGDFRVRNCSGGRQIRRSSMIPIILSQSRTRSGKKAM